MVAEAGFLGVTVDAFFEAGLALDAALPFDAGALDAEAGALDAEARALDAEAGALDAEAGADAIAACEGDAWADISKLL